MSRLGESVCSTEDCRCLAVKAVECLVVDSGLMPGECTRGGTVGKTAGSRGSAVSEDEGGESQWSVCV